MKGAIVMHKEEVGANKNISIDCGNVLTKWATTTANGEILTGSFLSKAVEYDGSGRLEEPEIVVMYGNKGYAMGEKGFLSFCDVYSNLTEQREVCVYTAIAQALINSSVDLSQVQKINLSLNVPLLEYKDEQILQGYFEKYSDCDRVICLEYNKQTIKFVISHFIPYYESKGIMVEAMYQEKTKKEYTLVVDIGGCRTTSVLFKNDAPVKNNNIAINQGILKCFYRISCDLSIEYKGQFSEHDVNDLITGKSPFSGDLPKFESFYNSHTYNLMKEIEKSMFLNVLDVEKTTFIFAGGGSKLLEETIRGLFPNIDFLILENPEYSNCLGMLEYLLRLR